MAFAMTLIGFWVISFISTQEFIASYMYCAGAESPLTDNKGMYFDGTPCVDRNSNGASTPTLRGESPPHVPTAYLSGSRSQLGPALLTSGAEVEIANLCR